MPEPLQVLLPLLVSVAGTGLVAGAGALRSRLAAPLAVGTAVLAFITTLLSETTSAVSYGWAPTWGLQLSLSTDGLARLYMVLATGVGLLVLVYSSGYLPLHLLHTGSAPERGPRFFALILLFMTAMMGLVMSQDIILLILFWDLTAITSYFLIGYDHQRRDSRRAALTALLITVASAIFLIAAGALVMNQLGTASIPEILEFAEPGTLTTVIAVLIAIAALAKSAQAPLHFWLPRAMAAPTPVSAYLHSAAMVAAGVFLLARLYRLLALSPGLMDSLVVIGFASMAVGGVMALAQHELKRILAYSTIGQYGYVVVLIGLGNVAAAEVYVFVHALIKSALFLTAGSVTEATGETRLERLGGLWNRMPWIAIGSGLAAAGLAALPLTGGFFKDEVFFAGAADRGGIVPLLAVAGAALTFTYSWRFWGGIFVGRIVTQPRSIPVVMVAPIVLLGALVFGLGVFPGVAAELAEDAAAASTRQPLTMHLAYHFNLEAPNVMAIATWVVGLVLVATSAHWAFIPRRIARASRHVGPDRIGAWIISALNSLSRRMHAYEVQTLQQRIGTIFVAAAIVVGVTILFAPPWPSYRVGRFPIDEWPLALFLVLAALSAMVATFTSGRLSLVLALSAVGYSLTAVFVFNGAPDVALVAVLIETMMTLLLLGVISLLPRNVGQMHLTESVQQRRRGRVIGVLAAGFAFAIAWGVLSRPAPDPTMSRQLIQLSPSAHASDIVTAILADFRGLDTMGEITVIAIALLGTLALFTARRRV